LLWEVSIIFITLQLHSIQGCRNLAPRILRIRGFDLQEEPTQKNTGIALNFYPGEHPRREVTTFSKTRGYKTFRGSRDKSLSASNAIATESRRNPFVVKQSYSRKGARICCAHASTALGMNGLDPGLRRGDRVGRCGHLPRTVRYCARFRVAPSNSVWGWLFSLSLPKQGLRRPPVAVNEDGCRIKSGKTDGGAN